MTGIEALQALRDGKKVKRPGWSDDEYLSTYVTSDGCVITSSKKYYLWRIEDTYHLESTPRLIGEILDELLASDWEAVE